MKNIFTFFSKNQAFIYKILLFVLATLLVIYLFPKGGQFKYSFQKGKPWQYENLYAPFSFTIKKDKETLDKEAEGIRIKDIPYFKIDSVKLKEIKFSFNENINETYDKNLYSLEKEKVIVLGNKILDNLYLVGVIDEIRPFSKDKLIYLTKGSKIEKLVYGQLVKMENIERVIASKFPKKPLDISEEYVNQILLKVVLPNVVFNNKLTETTIKAEIEKINPNKGVIEKGSRIISKGEVVEGSKFQALNSLRTIFQSQVWSKSNYYWLLLGYSLLVSMVFLMLFMFLKNYRTDIYNNNTKVTFIFFNIILMIFITTFIVKYDAKLVYIAPLCILPLVLKTFFDARVSFFVYIITLLLLGFIVPNSFEFLFLQIIAGMTAMLVVDGLYRRANLFISVGQITLVYIVGYFAFFIIQEGNVSLIEYKYFGYFILSGLLTLFAFPLVYIYEKLFGLVSDVSLLELSDTNSKLLKELSNKAPGTFHHSLNVANLAEAAANEIGANAMLVRVGALYHDIGKMINPTYFTENQIASINPHDELDPKESAQIIIDHVIKGIEIAKKNNLPDRIIDFIRTHHGTSVVYYFYFKAKTNIEGVDKADFQYPGPIPFSKETAILMMADSVEAASKSLKEPTTSKLDSFVEKIIDTQIEQGQFLNSDITFKEIQKIKKVLKKKLNNMYHLRIEYPE